MFKKLLVSVAVSGLFVGSAMAAAPEGNQPEPKVVVAATTESVQELIQSKGYLCMTCHQVETKVIGPAYKDVAAKYKGADQATKNRLAKQVKEGKMADLVWGETPMPPNPTVTDEDAKTLIEWVLSLAPVSEAK